MCAGAACVAMLCVLLAGMQCTLAAAAQTPAQVVATMAANEVKARNQDTEYSFLADEVSARTGGHRWTEKVVELDDGSLHRLLAIDGKPLSPAQAQAETTRLDEIAKHPEDFRRAGRAHRDDETHAEQLLQLLPKAFVITPAGEAGGCTQFAFHPDPSFQPSSYEERIAVTMVGTVSMRQPENRLCSLEATMSRPVEFGFGLIGRIEQGGHFRLERVPIDRDHWKSDRIAVHMQGRILLLKTLTREQDVFRKDIHLVPPHLSLEQAIQLSTQ